MAFCFLDRDGTINVDHNYLSDPAGLELLPGAVAGLQSLAALGYRLVIVTNQSGVGRGFFSRERAEEINRALVRMLAGEGVTIDGVFSCFHGPDAACDCRKPGRGMADQAVAVLGGTLEGALVIGDNDCDMGLARAIGARGILIADPVNAPDFGQIGTARDLVQAAAIASSRAPRYQSPA